MFRLSKVTDYGIVVLAHLARSGDGAPQNARALAEAVELPSPVVSKVLKSLAAAGVVQSQRGSKGGYGLAHSPEELSVERMVAALEGPVSLTECTLGPDICVHHDSCTVQSPWQVINRVIHEALSQVTLADLIDPTFESRFSMAEVLARVQAAPFDCAEAMPPRVETT